MAAPKAHFSVGIAGLPNPVRTMVPGKTYAVNVRTRATTSCQDNSIAEALRDQRPVIAVVRTPAAELLQRLASQGIRTDEVLKQGRLQILQRIGEPSEKLRVHGARHFTDELDFFTLPKNTLLVVEDAEDLFKRLLALRNDVGLLAEEYDPRLGCLVGNFPQAFSHVALLNSARLLRQRAKPADSRSIERDKTAAGDRTPQPERAAATAEPR